MPWSYLPHTPQDRKAMLTAVGVFLLLAAEPPAEFAAAGYV
ncbi:hypothetical protein SOV_48190 [Sporomusa ovata DSM 2662]|uniref:Uncharacterized protein n=1 Tax=Sporomusa ovata TaxID=2378 RepID=A0A0U1L0F6_9FIRM|nr:hypothetical protein [Sporomusa ovata]EQB27195.1 hypothetical protein SOV_2c00880 [Sporomusa ovata DSM 2662]CQR73035.1 hypothetical protein SpAn4DRAFT_2267 [Sporomusa ovata]